MVLSPAAYNEKVGLAIFCPITSHVKGYPFEVPLPDELEVNGVILSDQVKSLDWKVRRAELAGKLPDNALDEILEKLATLIKRNP